MCHCGDSRLGGKFIEGGKQRKLGVKIMGFIGDLAKVILLSRIVFWVIGMVWFFINGQLAIAFLFLAGLLIPLSFVVYEYWNYKKDRGSELRPNEVESSR